MNAAEIIKFSQLKEENNRLKDRIRQLEQEVKFQKSLKDNLRGLAERENMR